MEEVVGDGVEDVGVELGSKLVHMGSSGWGERDGSCRRLAA